MRYFKRFWEENRGDAYAEWGCSWWYFEVDDEGWVERQLENYDDGTSLKYSRQHLNDEYGGLSEAALDLSELVAFEIPRAEFEEAWSKTVARNVPQL